MACLEQIRSVGDLAEIDHDSQATRVIREVTMQLADACILKDPKDLVERIRIHLHRGGLSDPFLEYSESRPQEPDQGRWKRNLSWVEIQNMDDAHSLIVQP